MSLPIDPSNPLGVTLCSFFKRGDCMKGVECHFIHTDQVKRVYGHPWFPFFSYVKPPSHFLLEKEFEVDVQTVNHFLKVQSIKSLRFCKAYPSCKQGKHCSFLHDQRIKMMMMEDLIRSGAAKIQSQLQPLPKPLSPNAAPFSPSNPHGDTGTVAHPFSPRPVQLSVQDVKGFGEQSLPLPNLILSPVSSPVSSPSNQNQKNNQSIDFTMPASSFDTNSTFSFYSPENQYKVAAVPISTPVNPFEAHLKKASPLFRF